LNGAGILFYSGRLLVRNCLFEDNETGLLSGNDHATELAIEASEFGHNGAGDGFSHNLYAGTIRKLTVRHSYFHHARVGHLLKSRASESYIMHNRLTDGPAGRASYELEFPNGGLAYVVGNTIQQGPHTENPALVSFGAEGYRWPRNELHLIGNTLVDDLRENGQFLVVRPGAHAIRAVDNVLVGPATDLRSAGAGEYSGNVHCVALPSCTPASGLDNSSGGTDR
jgi:hypothetical protein